MSFEYLSVEEAMPRRGPRMVVVGGVPSPWGEAAKGILHVKGIAWAAVRLDYTSDALKQWTGGRRDGPIAFFDDEPPRAGWDQILLLAERLAPAARLQAQQTQGSRYYLGHAMSVVDIYSATFVALFQPLPESHCPGPPPLAG